MAKKQQHHIPATSILIGVLAVFVGVLSILFVQQQSSAKNDDLGKQLVRKECDAKGEPLINVTQHIINDVDSGQAGNYWAYDTIKREIKVWNTGANSYCATVRYEGKFAAIAGQKSPGNTGTLSGSEKGTFEGGYRAEITGTLLTIPLLPKHGSVGTTDYACDIHGNCPGAFDWTSKYFNTSAAGYTFAMPWWGWIYRDENHVWVNAVTGNSGDII